ncbi:DNA recombination-mediator protein A [Candidatus Gugararchaeum adminiculabundum]|nr:DNA recombination-mediator protein A [Candidatus Gugararchaeum adminiculabundum]
MITGGIFITLQIGVIGSGATTDKKVLALAKSVGEEIAKNNAILITGGIAGVMEAASFGCATAKGLSIGVIPTSNKQHANKYCHAVICTAMGLARNALIASSSDGLIVIGGEAGTLSEMCLAWQMDRPIVAIKGSGGFADQFAGKKMDSLRDNGIIIESAPTPQEAVNLLIRLIREKGD